VKKTTNVPNERLTLEFNVWGLLDVRVKPLKSRPINRPVENARRSSQGVGLTAPDQFEFGQAIRAGREGARERCFDLCRFDHNKTIDAQVGRADAVEIFTPHRR
jgi:hypothetical protein